MPDLNTLKPSLLHTLFGYTEVDQEWYSPEEAAPLLGCSAKYVRQKLCDTGILKHKRHGRDRRIHISTIKEYQEASAAVAPIIAGVGRPAPPPIKKKPYQRKGII